MIFDGHGPTTRVSWIDSYTIDLSSRRYCEARCGRLPDVHGQTVVID
jgi:hypothetical protein